MQSFEGKVAIVTGASEGIGARLAKVLKERGAKLSVAARNESRLREQAGSDAVVVAGDLTQEAVRTALIAQTVERWGGIDILINNAGFGSYRSVFETSEREARAVFDLNFFVPLELARMAAPWLRKTRGTLVNVGSIASEIPLPWLPIYSASKAALASLTATQRIEMRRDGVNVIGVFPGYVNTSFQEHALGSSLPDRVVQGKRFAVSVEDCAEAIVKGIEQRRRVVVTPGSGWPLMLLHRLLPSVVEARLG
jgi:short-subunit dehydrogenase